MEQSVYRNGGNERFAVLRGKIKYYFKETFRPHSREEYAEIFSRGIGSDSGYHGKYPWLYMRALALFFILFGFITLVYRLSGDYFDYPTLILFGGLMVNVPLLVFFFELYPKRDISFLALILVMLIGGTVSAAISGIGYEYIYEKLFGFVSSDWLSLVFTGVWEEFAKAVPVIIAILLLKKREPLACFLIGAAVGTGFSVYEDMGYIYGYSRTWTIGFIDFKWAVLCAVGRGFACVCSHAPWTAVIGWAFGRFEKPFKNYRFYAVVLFSMFLHYWADVPFFCEGAVWYRGGIVIWIFEVPATVLEMFFMIRRSRRELSAGAPPCPETEKAVRVRLKYSHSANLAGVITCCILSLMVCIYCVIPFGYENVRINFPDSQSFVNYMQCGYGLKSDWGRAYDEELSDYAQFVQSDAVKNAVQEVAEGDFTYFYFYEFTYGETAEDTENTENAEDIGATDNPSEVTIQKTLTNIAAVVEGELYYSNIFIIFEDFYYAVGGTTPNVGWVDLSPFLDGNIAEPDDPETPEEPEEPEEPEAPETPEEPEESLVPIEVFCLYYINSDETVNFGYDTEAREFFVVTAEETYKGLAGQIAVYVLSALVAVGGAGAFITLKIKARRYKNA